MSKEAKYIATLVHGNTYVLGGKFFEQGVAVPVSVSEMEHLEEYAVVRYKSQGRVFPQCQFEFEEVDAEKDLAEDEVEAKPAAAVKSRKKVN